MARRSVAFGRYVGLLYALNTLGAVVGVLAAGTVLIGEIGETNTIAVGVALNFAVAAMTFFIAWATKVARKRQRICRAPSASACQLN